MNCQKIGKPFRTNLYKELNFSSLNLIISSKIMLISISFTNIKTANHGDPMCSTPTRVAISFIEFL